MSYARSRNEIPGVRRRLDEHAARRVREAAHEQRDGAQRRAPVDTGALRASIEAIQLGVMQWLVVAGEPYGRPVNDGHVLVSKDGKTYGYAPARPFWTSTLEAVRPRFFESMRSIR